MSKEGKDCIHRAILGTDVQKCCVFLFVCLILKVHLLKLGRVKKGRTRDRRSNRRKARQACSDSVETMQQSFAPRRGYHQLPGQSGKRGPWRQVQGISPVQDAAANFSPG